MGKKKSSSTAFTIAEVVKSTFGDVELLKETTDEVVFKKNGKTVQIIRKNDRTTCVQLFADKSKRLLYAEVQDKYMVAESINKAKAAIEAALA